jgi:hypothetical protein
MPSMSPAPRLISARVHAVLDYAFGALLAVSPWLFGFADAPIAAAVAMSVGGGAILYSLFTRYPATTRIPLSIYGVLPFNAHLGLDLASGLFLIVSPWFCMFADRIWWPHVVFGLLEVGVTLLTGFRGATAADAAARDPGSARRHAASGEGLAHPPRASGRPV